LPEGAPARPAEPVAYPAVHDMPPPRSGEVLNMVEQEKMESDLVAARNRQQAEAGIPPTPTPAVEKKTRPSRRPIIPVASSNTIY
jgi:hypothetical protein